MSKPYSKPGFVERFVSFWFGFGVAYLMMRYVFGAGHLAAALAYLEAGVTMNTFYIGRKVGAF